MRYQLLIVVADDCPNCEHARELAEQITEQYLELEVTLVKVDDPQASIPAVVFATPTYLLDGRVVSLGNPRLADISGWMDPGARGANVIY